MIYTLIQIFLTSFLINLLWEVLHSTLYTTCLRLSLKRYVSLIVGASLKDAFWISTFFLISIYIFGKTNILENKFQLLFFVIVALIFSFIDEKISLSMKRWKYSRQMSTIFGVGITPLLELVITGILTFFFVFLI